jgi:uncharacterized membrane protein YjjP (DUF1212 family)/uncharacterized membrane protein YjjB (DUF3815 family)
VLTARTSTNRTTTASSAVRLGLLVAAGLALCLGLLVPPAGASAEGVAEPSAVATDGVVAPGADPGGSEPTSTATSPTTDATASPTATGPTATAPTAGPTTAPTTAPTGRGSPAAPTGADPTAEPAPAGPSQEPSTVAPRPLVTTPAVRRSTIPLGSVVLALVVLTAGALLVRAVVRREPRTDAVPAAVPPPTPTEADDEGGLDPATREFLLGLGEALVDAGDAIHHVQETLEEVAAVNGASDVGIVVMPTALFISVPHGDVVQTEVASAGTAPLRLDQVDEVFRIVDAARRGELGPTAGLVALARARIAPPPFPPRLQLVGYMLFTLGLVLILRGSWLELALGAVLGLLVGALTLATERLRPGYQPFLPVGAALGVSVVVFTAARMLPELSVFPPLVAALVAFLPGALLTTGVFELSTGQIVSGSGRLAAGALRLVLLALGILAAAALVGVPAAAIGEPPTGAVSVLAPWLGVAVFGVGVVLFKGARWSSAPWILLVLYVAYAGQVLGGLFFGVALSAFFGALVMTPVAMLASRQPSGPPALVSFLPGFWLLVPGAVGLEGVTRFLDEDTLEGLSSLVTMGTSMVGIALGVLLGLAIGTEVTARARRAREPDPAAGST